ncbi:rRNA pseudouridine synthase [Enterococcus durans]|uniref:Pseudouridine synthase n=1 Tax=Enterococcus durans TaxID=53345 RepID=A0A5N0YPU1_9ENTE|nr:pseudouridine synthase [Enterococcus durans]KAA9177722.1 rRNA pseudouridine synthase [Enterococcus durans]KAA9183481.1 rRNA pseudouridine synthase [Enterococcus durans]KAA9184712.1 rRNA pseudouridine synthase [Enterococcus durans]KAA9189414.1 rRNA pseudouridine synthase [Enterococcus durans]KAA9191757.1 rRNA pseudouridine synthase [Enterococcus durans]
MRLDKFLAEVGIGSRKEVKVLIKKGQIKVNEKVIKSDKFQVKEFDDQITYLDEPLVYQKDFYYVLNKPAGVISATQDNYEQTVMDLLSDEDYREDLFPVGRLDKDTEGLLILTNNGQLAHRLLSPRKHVEKEYFAEVKGIMTAEDQQSFARGLVIDKDEQTLPAQLFIDAVDSEEETSKIRLILHEGKFHQVKRMVQAVGKEVTYLKRIRMGGFSLPNSLDNGEYRELTEAELLQLQEQNK